ncbi:MAG: HEAT repeat domain-containing protein [Phycisphaerales bacterium]
MTHRRARCQPKASHTAHPLARSSAACLALAAIAALAGCQAANIAPPGSKPTTARTQDPTQQSGLLSMFAPPPPETAAAWATDPYDPDLRYRGTLLLGTASWGGEPLYLELYEQHAQDPEPNVRVAAIRALGNHAGPEQAGILVAALDDPEERVRLEAARSLQRIHAPDAAIDPLRLMLRIENEPSAEVRAAAATALGQYPRGTVVQALIASLEDRTLAVNHASLESLRILTGQDFGYDRRAWSTWAQASNDTLFASAGQYTYPVFNRPRKLIEWLPFIPPPPNEQTGVPEGTPIGG